MPGVTALGKRTVAKRPDDLRYPRGGTIGTRWRAAAARAEARNSIDLGPMTSPPTITQSTSVDSSLNTSQRAIADNAPGTFRFRGGTPIPYATYFYRMGAVTTLTSGTADATHDVSGAATEFWCDEPKFAILCAGGTDSFMIEVNGQPVASSAIAFTFTNAGYITVDFGGVRANRHIRFEAMQASGAFGGVYTTAAGSVWQANLGLRMAAVGDSVVAQTGASLPQGGYAQVMGKLLGFNDVVGIAIGGTGFTLANSHGATIASASRVADAVTANPDVLFLPSSQNDATNLSNGTGTTAQLTAAALAGYRAYRAALPGVPFILGGCTPAATGPSSTILAVEDAMNAAFVAFNDPLSWWIPVARATDSQRNKPWIFGTGYTSAPSGSGNSDVLMGGAAGADASHPNQTGHYYLGRRWAQAIRAVVLTSGALV